MRTRDLSLGGQDTPMPGPCIFYEYLDTATESGKAAKLKSMRSTVNQSYYIPCCVGLGAETS